MKIVFDEAEAKVTGYESIELDEINSFSFNNQMVIEGQNAYMGCQLSLTGKNPKVITNG